MKRFFKLFTIILFFPFSLVSQNSTDYSSPEILDFSIGDPSKVDTLNLSTNPGTFSASITARDLGSGIQTIRFRVSSPVNQTLHSYDIYPTNDESLTIDTLSDGWYRFTRDCELPQHIEPGDYAFNWGEVKDSSNQNNHALQIL